MNKTTEERAKELQLLILDTLFVFVRDSDRMTIKRGEFHKLSREIAESVAGATETQPAEAEGWAIDKLKEIYLLIHRYTKATGETGVGNHCINEITHAFVSHNIELPAPPTVNK